MSDWTNGVAGAGLTGLALALGYAGLKLIKRSRCASHMGCCELDISRAETERRAHEDVRSTMLEVLKEHLGQQAAKKGDVHLEVLNEQPQGETPPVVNEESKEGSYVQYHIPPSSM